MGPHAVPQDTHIKFSLLIPTRERVNLLDRLLASIEKTTDRLDEVEVLVAYDTDDFHTCNFLSQRKRGRDWLRPLVRDRGRSLSVDYQNWMFRRSKGSVWILNDDTEIMTEHWDTLAKESIAKFLEGKPDGVYYGWTADSTDLRLHTNPAEPYSCFPILSRNAVEALGYAMPPYYSGWTADVYLYKVYAAVNRVIDLSFIFAKHYTHWLGIRERDSTSHSMERMSHDKDRVVDPGHDIHIMRNYIISNGGQI